MRTEFQIKLHHRQRLLSVVVDAVDSGSPKLIAFWSYNRRSDDSRKIWITKLPFSGTDGFDSITSTFALRVQNY
jgi:hypothetical protein